MKTDYYEILGVPRNATDDEITKAYRKIAVQSHPDKQQGKSEKERKDAEERFKMATEAKDILLDKEKRRMYDTFGTVDGAPNFGNHSEDALNEFLKRHFGPMGNPFASQQQPQKGADKHVRMRVSLEEVYNMSAREFEYTRRKKRDDCHGTGSADGRKHDCPYCHGTGTVTETYQQGFMITQSTHVCQHCHGTGTLNSNPCKKCGGSGTVTSTEKYTITITPQVLLQGGVRIPGMGHASPRQGVSGDLIVAVELKPHEYYEIDSQFNLKVSIDVPVLDCLTGGEVDVKLIDGSVHRLKFKECTKNGSKFKLAGKGMRRPNNTFGDLVVTINYSTPDKLDKESRRILEKLKKTPVFKQC